MFDKQSYQCPACSALIRDVVKDGDEFTCSICGGRFGVLLDEARQTAVFVERGAGKGAEPLFLPKGSVRALITIGISVSAWGLIFIDQEVPGYVYELVLATVAYYFGLRKTLVAAQSRLRDPGAEVWEPLFLPTGFIRVLLIVGFVISGGVLFVRGQLGEAAYLEFFAILLGLILGFVFAKVHATVEGSVVHRLVSHGKGALALAGTGFLVYLLLTGQHTEHTYVALALACGVSFYFGSRS